MLTALRIKNFGLADEVTLEFEAGFTALTGETGAGKSLIIGALSLLLGQRADRKLIRAGAENCAVEAVFDVSALNATIEDFLAENGLEPCENAQLLLRRAVTAAGNNRQFVNHSPASLSILAALGQHLVDIHGPHDHQSLFHNQKQLELLDDFAGIASERLAYARQFAEWKTLLRQKQTLLADEQARARQIDLLRFQTREIEDAQLSRLDEQTLENDYQRAQNAAQIGQLGQSILNAVGNPESGWSGGEPTSEPSLADSLARIGRELRQLAQLDPQTQPLADSHAQLVEQTHDWQTQLSRYLDAVHVYPNRLAELEEQINRLQTLKRKYGSAVQEIIQFGNQARQKLKSLESRDIEVEQIDRQIAQRKTELIARARKLTAARVQKGQSLSKAVRKQLEDLGFPGGRFEVELTAHPPAEPKTAEETARLRPSGAERIEFLFGPNPGEPLHPLKKIASSGEIARVMLALKTVLADQDHIPLLIFDEVDANVGGETAHAVGEKMHRLGNRRQILCITHLAPVAAAANHHLQVVKTTQNNRTHTQVHPLKTKQRIDELARMLGGKIPAAKKHAAALLPHTK